MKIPLDITLNDADATGSREGMLSLSPLNNDDSYANVSAWSYTWYGDKNVVGVEDGKMLTAKFNLEQNYPNPFNPVTQINYSISKQGFVSLKIYNILGSEVENLISENQTAGNYTVTFDASKLASGVYMYKLETENFISTKKMILMK
ncbi:MAG: T9SS type A sorting domain-containing protein [Ignavibacteriae bacterium]|nr:T9SS type A sorting domain-containing protein [Ignavibacteriota bacterium]